MNQQKFDTDSKKADDKKLLEFAMSDNVAELLDEDALNKLGSRVIAGYKTDEESLSDLKRVNEEAQKIAMQIWEEKTFPWEGAANIKYPLITVGCIQFYARTTPLIMQDDKVVKAKYVGLDPTGERSKIAQSVALHMSYQLTNPMSCWEQGTENLLMMLPLYGTIFRKSYWDSLDKCYKAEVCYPTDIVVNYFASPYEDPYRISHVFTLNRNEILERIRSGLYLDIPFGENSDDGENNTNDHHIDKFDYEHEFVEQHTWADLDEDGYEEPYIITVHKSSNKVARIVCRFDPDKVERNDKGQVYKITPRVYFTAYRFLPSPDGSYYGLGFGRLLYPLNEAVNTLFNQLLDSGAIANSQSGFIGKGLNLGKGPVTFRLGEWKTVETYGADLAKNIFALPVREPSNVLFQLLGMLIQASREISSVSDMLLGQQAAQNVTATTATSLIEQGQVVYKATQKSIYRSLTSEFQKQFDINRDYLDQEQTFSSLQGMGQIKPEFYKDSNILVFPVADPNLSTYTQKMTQIQALMGLRSDPDIDDKEVLRRYFQLMEIAEPDKLIRPDPKEPPPEVIKLQAEIELLKMQKADILMKRELEALGKENERLKIIVQAAQVGGANAHMKLNNVAKFAELEVMNAHKAIDAAIQDTAKAEAGTNTPQDNPEIPSVDIAEEIEKYHQVISNIANPPPPPEQQPPMPPGAEGAPMPPGAMPFQEAPF